MGAATWLWNQRGDPESLPRVAAGGYGFTLSGAASARKTEMDLSRMGNFRKKPASKVLSTEGRRKKTTDQGTLEVGAAFGRERGPVGSGANATKKKGRG